MGNAGETPVYFDMPSNTCVNEKGAKSILIKSTGNEKLHITAKLGVMADDTKLKPYVILR